MATKSFVEFIEKGGIRKYFKDTRFNPVSKSSSMTQDVGLGDDGKFYTNPGFNIHGLATQNTLDDADEMAFHDTSASAQRKTTWSNIKSKLKSYFDTIYLSGTSLVGYATQAWVQSQGYGTYTKPSGGIPKTDLASSVQTSLNNADNAVRYTPQTLTDGQKDQARVNIGAYFKPLVGIPENDLTAEVRAKLNSTADNIITITTEDTDPLYPYMSSKTLAEIKASFANKSEQFVFYNNISYKLEKIEPRVDLYGGNEKAVFYSTARLVNNELTYYTCEIYDGEFGYSAADFHTYTVSSGGGDLTGAVRYDAVQSLTGAQKTQARSNIGAYTKPSNGIPKTDLASGVQTSLSNADKAVIYDVQSLTDGQKAQARTNIGAGTYSKPASGIPKTDLSSDVQNKIDEAITSVNGKTGTSVVLGAEDINVEIEAIYGTTDLENAVNDLYERINSRVQIITWVDFDWDFDNNEWVSDLTWNDIQDAYLSGRTVQARLHTGTVPMILNYAGVRESSGGRLHVFYAATSSNIVVVDMSYNILREHDIEVSYKPYNQDLTPYRTAADQDVIDATKQDVITDLATIRSGAAKGATALQSVPNAYRTAALQDYIDEVALAQKQDILSFGANLTLAADGRTLSADVPVKSVNGEIGSIYLDAANLKTTIPQPDLSVPHEVEIYWDALADTGDMTVDGVRATRTNLNEAFSDGVKVNVNITFDGATLLANPILYDVVDNVLNIQCYASGEDYGDGTPVKFWLDAANYLQTQSGRTLDNPTPLPAGRVYTIEQYLELLDSDLDGKVNMTQGVAEAGKFLVVGDDGNVTTMALAEWQGGSY